ncbi:MAG: putative zinc-binding protein [Verrucomicrobiae bacterium]
MNSNPQCTCQSAPKLIFPCSGAADVGGLADRAARQMTLDQVGKMYCLAGIGGRVRDIMETTSTAAKVLVIDGCPQECARKTMEQAGFTGFQHLKLASLGLLKGSSTATDDNIRLIASKGAELLA